MTPEMHCHIGATLKQLNRELSDFAESRYVGKLRFRRDCESVTFVG